MRVALVSVGLGRIRRGFERYMADLADVVRSPDLEVTLFKAAGENTPREKVPPLYPAIRRALGFLPTTSLVGGRDYREYKRDSLAFALGLLPELVRGRFDVLHVIDPPLAVILDGLRRRFPFRTPIVFTEGTLMPPPFYPSGMHIHLTALETYQEALCMGVPKEKLTLLPVGLHVRDFVTTAERAELRRKYDVPESRFVVLLVTAIRRIHKRVHYAIDEVSRTPGDVLLWIDGNQEDPVAVELARQKLGPRCRITHVPSADVPELCRLADVMVHCATNEAYGLAVAEALASGVPTLVHDSPHFEWLTRGRECLVDMSRRGALAERLQGIAEQRDEYAAAPDAKAEKMRAWLDWGALRDGYVDMYRRVSALRP
ncbi:MAG: glycosyltransferase family 4 protein [Bryobacteraceae bacterium]|nr:glycosyltransferase family 4 protein [Bryobacteraceae bacterium]